MVTASFEFHGKLNDFLKPVHRYCSVRCVCAQSATTKHMIEVLGIPHTEIGLIEVNKQVSSLQYLLQDGDHVLVHPLVYPVQHHQAVSAYPASPHFLADAHLGGLARLLRMAGFDTLYDNFFRDDEIVRIAAEQNRVILTRDLELLKRRNVIAGCYVRTLQPAGQMEEVVVRFGLAQLARPFTLCLHCNVPLTRVEKAAVLECLPPSVQECQNEFSRCSCCKRVYWKGSHWQRMQNSLRTIISNAGAA
jgi:uncharacterized protein with PIN domain